MKDGQENRVKMVVVSEQFVLTAFTAIRASREYLAIPVLKGLPDDLRIERVFHHQHRRAFVFIVFHPTFDEVPGGQEPPYLTGHCNDFTAVELFDPEIHSRK